MSKVRDPESRRPELLLLGVGDHIELGSAIRSAAAFGWRRAFVEDWKRVWFGCDRITYSEGRAAARWSRNPIKLVPCTHETRHSFPEVTIATTSRVGVPLHRTNLARGRRHLVVIPDESQVQIAEEAWERLGRKVQFAHLSLPVEKFTYHYRLVATVALAEVSHQVGYRLPQYRSPRHWAPFYGRVLEMAPQVAGEDFRLGDLLDW